MKRTIKFLFIMCMAFLLTACTKDNDASNTNTNVPEKSYTANVTAPTNWTKNTNDSYSLVRYDFRSDSGSLASFWIRPVNKYSLTADNAITSYKETESKNDDAKFVWEDVKEVKVNEYNAKKLTYNMEYGSLKSKYDVYFVEKGNSVFTIVCYAEDIEFDSLKTNFDEFLSSFTITEE